MEFLRLSLLKSNSLIYRRSEFDFIGSSSIQKNSTSQSKRKKGNESTECSPTQIDDFMDENESQGGWFHFNRSEQREEESQGMLLHFHGRGDDPLRVEASSVAFNPYD